MLQNVNRSTIALLVMAILVISCSRDNSVVSNSRLISKHKYTKGFHLNLKKGAKSIDDHLAKHENQRFVESEKTELNATNLIHEKNEIASIETSDYAIVDSKDQRTTYFSGAIELETNLFATSKKTNDPQTTNLATKQEKSFHASLKKTELKARVKTDLKKAKTSSDLDAIVYIILAIFIPFVAVGLATDWRVSDVVINLLLCLLFFLPGVIHAFIICDREGVI